MSVVLHNGYLPGCIGRITSLHAGYYSAQAGFGLAFEARVAQELAEFCRRYDDRRDGLWLASGPQGIQGSIAIDGSGADEQGAHLRWFIVSPEAQGAGLGTRLLSAALDFCRARGYRRTFLWTFEGLDAARHLYEKFGFRLASQQRGAQWGKEVVEQQFVLHA